VLHHDERGAGDLRARGCCIAPCGEWRGATLLQQWANDYGTKKKAQGRFAKLTGGWRAGFCNITPPLTPAYGSRSNVSDTSFHSLHSYMVST
jgi:hypothetical protein